MRGGLQGRFKVQDVAEIQCGMMQGFAVGCCPEIQTVTVGLAGEAVIDLPGKVDGEGPAGS
jgi:hypothetical protein